MCQPSLGARGSAFHHHASNGFRYELRVRVAVVGLPFCHIRPPFTSSHPTQSNFPCSNQVRSFKSSKSSFAALDGHSVNEISVPWPIPLTRIKNLEISWIQNPRPTFWVNIDQNHTLSIRGRISH